MPRALPELAAVVDEEERQRKLPEYELQVWLHTDERGRLHRRWQLRDRVRERRLLRKGFQLPQFGVRGRRLLRREPEHLPDWVPRLLGRLPTVGAAAVAANRTIAIVAAAVAANTTIATVATTTTVTVATTATVATTTTVATTARALLSWRRLRVLRRQPVRQGPVAPACESTAR